MRRTFAFAVAVKRARRLCSVAALALTSGLAVAQQAPPVDFGDLIILYRDASGVPYITTEGVAVEHGLVPAAHPLRLGG